MEKNTINPECAIALRMQGYKWRQIGIMMAQELGRQMPFAESSVKAAVKEYQRKRQEEEDALRDTY